MSKILSLKNNKETYTALGFFAGMAVVTVIDLLVVVTSLLSMYAPPPPQKAKKALDGAVIPQAIQLIKTQATQPTNPGQ